MELEEDLPPQQEAEKRKKKRKDRRKTNSSESSPTNPFKVEPCKEQEQEQEEQEELEELVGSENVNQKPRVVVPSPPGILFLQMTFNFSLDNCQIFSSL